MHLCLPTLHKQNTHLLLTDAELAYLNQGAVDRYFDLQRRFGNAGGPDIVSLTHAGWERAYDIACIYRFKLEIAHIHSLEQLHGAGEQGMPIRTLTSATYTALRQMDCWLTTDAYQRSLAAALQGDEALSDQVRHRNRLLYVDLAGSPAYRITELGCELVTTAHRVATKMAHSRAEYLQMPV